MSALAQAPTRLTPHERLEALCDPGTIRTIRSGAVSAKLGPRAIAGDGVVGATGTVDGRPIACYAQDGSFLGGSLGERHADTIVRVLQTARRAQIPVVGFVESGGARMQEGTAALAGYGRIFRETVALTGIVPQISVVTGTSAGGGAYSPALTDLLLMTEDAAMFLTGPGVVREALGEEIGVAELGGPRVHDRNGVCHLVERDEPAAAARVRELRAAEEPEVERARLAEAYAEEHLRADTAAAAGFVDEIIEPTQTRDRLAYALESFAGLPPFAEPSIIRP